MYHIIINPLAGGTKAIRAMETIERVFNERGEKFSIHRTDKLGDSRKIAAALTRPAEDGDKKRVNVIVVGGDGTVHEVLNGITDPTRCNLGIIPMGTGNDFATTAGIPEDVERALDIIIGSEPRDTDFLIVGGVRCMNIAGLGIDVEVLARYARAKKKGKLTYFRCLLQSVFTYKGTKIDVEIDGEKSSHLAFIAAACNGNKFGGGIVISPTAKIGDGKISVTVVDMIKGLGIIKALSQLSKGKITDNPAAHAYECDRISVKSDEKFIVQLDGELYENLDFDVTLGTGLKMFR